MLTPSLPDPTMVTDELLTNVNMIEEDLYIHPEEISMADSDIWDMMQTKMEEKKEALLPASFIILSFFCMRCTFFRK